MAPDAVSDPASVSSPAVRRVSVLSTPVRMAWALSSKRAPDTTALPPSTWMKLPAVRVIAPRSWRVATVPPSSSVSPVPASSVMRASVPLLTPANRPVAENTECEVTMFSRLPLASVCTVLPWSAVKLLTASP